VPNHAALPTAVGCAPNFSVFTTTLTHEVVEILTDPDGLGYGTFASWSDEVADLCEPLTTVVSGNTLSQYAINQSQASCGIHVTCNARKPICQPHLDAPTGSVAQTWVFGRGEPLGRLTDKVHALSLAPPASRVTTNASLNTAIIVIQTGSDDLRGEASAGDNADVTLHFSRGDVLTSNINGGIRWADHTTYAATLTVPTAPAARVSDITGLTISTHFGSGWGHDNWDIQSVALVVSFPSGSITSGPFPPPPVVHDWLLRTNVPLIRFTGHNHDLLLPLDNPPPDMGQSVTALNLVISTGNDDLRGGSGNNCDVTIHLKSGPPIVLKNVNAGHSWSNWSKHTIAIPLPRTGLRGGDITAVELYTHFRGLFGSSTIFTDNWNVQEVILEATLAAPATPAFAAPARE
jgi:hypothetical protein